MGTSQVQQAETSTSLELQGTSSSQPKSKNYSEEIRKWAVMKANEINNNGEAGRFTKIQFNLSHVIDESQNRR